MFWLNVSRGAHIRLYGAHGEIGWTEDWQDCRPFKNENGARGSALHRVLDYAKHGPDCNREAKEMFLGKLVSKCRWGSYSSHCKKWRADQARNLFDERYEVLFLKTGLVKK